MIATVVTTTETPTAMTTCLQVDYSGVCVLKYIYIV